MKLPTGKFKIDDMATYAETHWVPLNGGATSRLQYWAATDRDKTPTILVLPGASEFIEKYYEVALNLLNRGFNVAVLDWRGQGLATRPLANPQKHHYESFDDLINDLSDVLAYLKRIFGQDIKYILAHSMGGHITLRYLAERENTVERAILCAPMVDINYGRKFVGALKFIIKISCWLGFSKSYAFGQTDYGLSFRSTAMMNLLTSDHARFTAAHDYIKKNPKLALGGKTFGWLDAANRSIDRLKTEDVSSIHTKLLIIQAGNDRIVRNRCQTELVERLQTGALVTIDGARHEILQERDALREQFWVYFDEYMKDRNANQ